MLKPNNICEMIKHKIPPGIVEDPNPHGETGIDKKKM